MSGPLLIPTDAELQECQEGMRVSAPLNPVQFPGWEDKLKEWSERLVKSLEVSRQEQNDCNADSGATGQESRHFWCTGEMVQLARTYLYNACEYVTSPNRVGADEGTSIPSCMKVLTKGIESIGVAPGLPLESAWKYMTYERSASRFAERAKGAVIVSDVLAQHGPMPALKDLPLHCAVGGGLHFGVFWGVKFYSKTIGGRKYKVWTSVANGGQGHALEGVTCLWLENMWWPAIWNSHGDGLILMEHAVYEQYQRAQCAPFGGYGTLPDKPVERWEDQRITGGGLWPKFVA
jgi:hypothetical protein